MMKREHEELMMRALGDELTAAQQVEFEHILSADAFPGTSPITLVSRGPAEKHAAVTWALGPER